MGSIVGVLEAQVRASTQDFERGMERAERKTSKFGSEVQRIGARSAAAFGQAMGAVAASTAAAEKSWVTLGATILGAFATGGPIAGGIAIVAAGVGLLIGETKKAEKATNEYAKAWEEAGKKAKTAAAAAAEALDKAQIEAGAPDLSEGQIRIARLGVQIEQTEESLRFARLKAAQTEKGLRTILVDEDAISKAMAKVNVEGDKIAASLDSMKAEMRDLARLAEVEAEARERSAAAARKQAQDLAYFGDLERQDEARRRAALDADPRVRWLRSGRAPAETGGPFSGSSSGFTPGGGWEEGGGVVESSTPILFDPEDEIRKRETELKAAAEAIAAPFHDAFAAAIVDGARTGFRNLEDIGEALFANWLSMAARALSTRLFGGVFDAIAGVSGGGGAAGTVLQILPVAVPAATVNAGIQSSAALQSTINVVGSQVVTLEQYRAGR